MNNNHTVALTKQAEKMIETIQVETDDELIMLIGSGCCDGPTPQLFAKSNAVIPTLNQIVYKRERLSIYFVAPITLDPTFYYTIDVESDMMNDSFSLEGRYNCQFQLKSTKTH